MSVQMKKSDTTKLSHCGKVVTKVAKKSKSNGWKFLRALFWLIFVLAILASIALAYIWFNRISLTENHIRKLMAKQGYGVALDITKLSKTQAVVNDIEISKGNEVFFKAERVTVDYDINKRTAQRIELVRPYINVAFDMKGNITSVWMRPNPDGKQKLLLPPNGLIIEDATVDWQLMLDKNTALGVGRASVTADTVTDTHWSAHVSSNKSAFNTDLLRGDIQYSVFIETKDGVSFDVFGSVDGQNLATTLLPLDNFRANSIDNEFKFNLVRTKPNEKFVLSGWHNAHISGVSIRDYKVENIDLKFKNLLLDAQGQIFANWQIGSKAAQISNMDLRAELADKLTSHSAMANIPIVQNFTMTLYNKAKRLLANFDLSGQGTFVASEAGYKIIIDHRLRLEATNQAVIFTPNQGDFIQYNNADKLITLQSDIDWSGVQALKLTNFTMAAKSLRGTKIDTMQNMGAHIHSQKQWGVNNPEYIAKSIEKDSVRLAPFDIDFSYADQGNNLRTINISGAVDYDGPVPGGSIHGLKAEGNMQLQLQDDDFTLGFSPSEPLFIGTFTNPYGWTTRALTFAMEPQTNLLHKTSTSSTMQMVLTDVSTTLVDPKNTRHLDVQFKRLDVTTDFAVSPLHWQIEVSGTDIKSEDFPAADTHIVAPSAILNVYQTASGDTVFDILSPDTFVATDNVTIDNLHIGLNGSPDDITLDYRADSVTMVGGAVPVLPMHGTARLKSGELTGHAITNLPLTTDTSIDIYYRAKDGQGSAKILIPKIIFEPHGLQPQHLVSVLSGKLADVSGEISAEFDFVFGGGDPVHSSGTTDLKNLNIGTLVGPVGGINAKLTFASIFPLKTHGVQKATLAEFDPGFPLKNGTIKFEIVPGGITVYEATWPIDNIDGSSGKIFLSPTDWHFGDVENRVVVNVENVGLGTMLAGIGKDKLSATGQVFGTLPARIKGVDVLIEDGVLAIKDGGIIRYKSAATDAAAARNKSAEHAFKALENFHYKQLEARIDGSIDGAMALKVVFNGQNPDVLSGQPFQFNTVVKGELANVVRNMAGAFSNEENLARIVEMQKGKAIEQP